MELMRSHVAPLEAADRSVCAVRAKLRCAKPAVHCREMAPTLRPLCPHLEKEVALLTSLVTAHVEPTAQDSLADDQEAVLPETEFRGWTSGCRKPCAP